MRHYRFSFRMRQIHRPYEKAERLHGDRANLGDLCHRLFGSARMFVDEYVASGCDRRGLTTFSFYDEPTLPIIYPAPDAKFGTIVTSLHEDLRACTLLDVERPIIIIKRVLESYLEDVDPREPADLDIIRSNQKGTVSARRMAIDPETHPFVHEWPGYMDLFEFLQQHKARLDELAPR